MKNFLISAYRSVFNQTGAVKRAKKRLLNATNQKSRFLICIPYLKSGGAERVVANICTVLAEKYGPDSVTILVTDWNSLVVRMLFPENTSNNYPKNIKFVDVTSLSHASYDDRVWSLLLAIKNLQPEMIFNVNSLLLWECLERFAPELQSGTRIGTVAFSHCVNKGGREIGYTATHLERMLPYLNFVLSDNKTYIEYLTSFLVKVPVTEKVLTKKQWHLAKIASKKMSYADREMFDMTDDFSGQPPSKVDWMVAKQVSRVIEKDLSVKDIEKFKVIYQPAPTTKEKSFAQKENKRPQIMWASRVTRQKFPEILPHIAMLLPNCDIHVYGAREIGYIFPLLTRAFLRGADLGGNIEKMPNIFWHGGYRSFDSLPVNHFDAFLYTSLYDGLPNVLLEAAAARIPVVAPMVGGISELINQATGWPVADVYNPLQYAKAILGVLDNPDVAVQKSNALVEVIAERHSYERFRENVLELVGDAHERDVSLCALQIDK